MASFSAEWPTAYHVLPLHAWRSVVADGAIRSKKELEVARPTTSQVDSVLGLDDRVHLYLTGGPQSIQHLPILDAQLGAASTPPFPHIALELRTANLDDSECTLCNWNLAVSRPGIDGYCRGGNWTRGTNPERIRAAWDELRRREPSVKKARGFFADDVAVPILSGAAIREHQGLLRRAPRRMPELMIMDEVPLSRFERVIAFGRADAEMLSVVGKPLPIQVRAFDGYDDGAVDPEVRRRIGQVLVGAVRLADSSLEFDRIRPSKKA